MDLPDVGPGSTLYLPVGTEGALLYLGDGHAVQGDGEVCGVAIEFATTTTVALDLVKGWNLNWPRLENDEFIMSIGSARPMEDAARIAYADLIQWMVASYGFDRGDAYLPPQIGKVRLGNYGDRTRLVRECKTIPSVIRSQHARTEAENCLPRRSWCYPL
jgi:acetamidase/formamidase